MKRIKNSLTSELSGSILLFFSSALAIFMSNSSLKNIYEKFLSISLRIKILNIDFSIPVSFLINDCLMSMFFFVVCLEIKKEITFGKLSKLNSTLFPFISSVGGMIIPAFIYYAINISNKNGINGLVIPITTDIVFVVVIMQFFHKRMSSLLRTFLLSLAIIDDIGAILIIAFFYKKSLSLLYIAIMIIFLILLKKTLKTKIKSVFLCIISLLILWILTLLSGIHPTLSGVILGFLIPIKHRKSISERLEKLFRPIVYYIILPAFAFTNMGIILYDISIHEIFNPISFGIILGLFFGKPIGISVFGCLFHKLCMDRNEIIDFRQILSVSFLCGVSFTMSIFISNLTFHQLETLNIYSKIGIIIGSFLSAFTGCILLNKFLPKK
ncbi:hypothetical protein AOQ88_02395 [Candidatus Riesia sp. GBBU]|nr:hypothetical protein AOQ88_02055 [Candidatus Riesia sp. GBBU]ARC55069.1 hypothetical protein AOQ88_02395 [Candidatus Riesia sp. GBBU]